MAIMAAGLPIIMAACAAIGFMPIIGLMAPMAAAAAIGFIPIIIAAAAGIMPIGPIGPIGPIMGTTGGLTTPPTTAAGVGPDRRPLMAEAC
jgi:hypothetical protein